VSGVPRGGTGVYIGGVYAGILDGRVLHLGPAEKSGRWDGKKPQEK